VSATRDRQAQLGDTPPYALLAFMEVIYFGVVRYTVSPLFIWPLGCAQVGCAQVHRWKFGVNVCKACPRFRWAHLICFRATLCPGGGWGCAQVVFGGVHRSFLFCVAWFYGLFVCPCLGVCAPAVDLFCAPVLLFCFVAQSRLTVSPVGLLLFLCG